MSRESLASHQSKRRHEVLDVSVLHGANGSDRPRVDEGFGGGFEDFEAVEGVEDAGAHDDDAVVFHEHGGAVEGEDDDGGCRGGGGRVVEEAEGCVGLGARV